MIVPSAILALVWGASAASTVEPRPTLLRGGRTLQTPPPPSNLRRVACGRGIDGDGGLSSCPEGDSLLANVDSLHEVRCCRDGAASGWKQKCADDHPNVFARSEIEGLCHEVSFLDAYALCGADGGRMCTAAEIFGSCAIGTGCNWDRELVWTCGEAGGACGEGSDCCSGRCGAGGECSPWPAANRAVNPGFEDSSVSPWYSNSDDAAAALTLDSSQSHSGSQSVLSVGRTVSWNGVQQNMFGKIDVGVAYRYSCWVKLKNASSSFFKLSLQIVKDTGTEKPGASKTVSDTSWTKLERIVTISTTGTLTDVTMSIEGPAAGVEYWVDDVEVFAVSTTESPTSAPTVPLPTTNPTAKWYIKWPISKCATNCVGPPPCGGIGIGEWVIFHDTMEACCDTHLEWMNTYVGCSTLPEGTESPTRKPTPSPITPTTDPTTEPTKQPTALPSKAPTLAPTTANPSKAPTQSPTYVPTTLPSKAPSASPTTANPSPGPTQSLSPSTTPSYCMSGILNKSVCCPSSCGRCGGSGCSQLPGGVSQCCTGAINGAGNYCVDFSDVACIVPGPSTPPPTASPTARPTAPPTESPTESPTASPSSSPTLAPTNSPTSMLTFTPTKFPTIRPTSYPAASPTSFPTSQPTSSPTANRVLNPGFEDAALSPWYPNFNSGTATLDASQSHSGSRSVLVTGRTAGWNGVEQNVFGKLEVGVQYQLSCWVKLKNASSSFFKLALRVTKDTEKKHPGALMTVMTDEWTKIEGTVTVDTGGTLTNLAVYVEGPAAGIEYWVDDVEIVEVATMNSPTSAPVSAKPTNAPTTKAPTKAPTPDAGGPSIYGDGPFVSLAASSEVATIPRPPPPAGAGRLRTGCPHEQGGLMDWHDVATWTNNVPNAGEDVTLPENSKVVIALGVDEELGVITIPASSELIFAENAAGIAFDIAGMDVQGALRAGSETCRYLTDLTMTLHGSRPNDLNIYGKSPTATTTYKGISVNGGTISIHGKRYYPTWTRLAQTAPAGQKYLLVQEQLDWEPGQEIVLTTTAVHDSRNWHQNEVLTVSSVVLNPVPGVGAAVHLTSTVAHNHIANRGYQAEVGLLSRNVKVQGAADDSEPTDPDPGTCTDRYHYGSSLAPCAETDTTGFGGHIMVHSGGKGYLEGVELYRMGQTNVLGRYPFHWHMLENGCEDCYFKDNSIHRSFYRCISIHGTHGTLVSENVAYDVSGYCYYLEDGVEEDNTLSFNLAAHIHPVSNIVANSGGGQIIPVFKQSKELILPADVTASGFYLTNLHNDFIGNAASGGWSGFALPVLHSPVGSNKNINMRPANRNTKTFDGNTAHSTGWWWSHAGAFYSGGSLYYPSGSDRLEYNAGRDQSKGRRSPCLVDKCITHNNCGEYCQEGERAWYKLTNSKVFMVASPGLNSWSGRMEVVSFEAHDVELGMEALESGFGIDNLLVECRSGESWAMPGSPNQANANGFFWYDTGQEHIITNAKFRNCGSRNGYSFYDSSSTRGCDTNSINGCRAQSTVWGLLTHSDQHTPEIMQATRNITYEDCGRRFKLSDYANNNSPSSVSGRNQNWLDVDGTASGLDEPTIIGSGLSDAGKWWDVESDTVHDPDGPLTFIKANNGPERGLGHIRLRWKNSVHNTVGSTSCFNGPKQDTAGNPYCPPIGRIRHVGPLFDASKDPSGGLPITANSEVPGLVGGFGWALSLYDGAPKNLRIDQVEVDSTTPLMLAISYPKGTSFSITAHAAYCSQSTTKSCTEVFQEADSIQRVRFSQGNTYYVDPATNVLWIRIIQFPQTYTGDTLYSQTAQWHLWDNATMNPQTGNPNDYALDRYSFRGITLPKSKFGYVNYLEITANCAEGSVSGYCANTPVYIDPQVCSPGYVQVSYDKCCVSVSSTDCESLTRPPTAPPTPPPTYGQTSNLVDNPGFESVSLSPWYANYGTGVTIDTSQSHSGSKSVLCADRTYTWNGVEQNLLGRLDVGVQYRYSCWVKLKNVSSSFFKLAFRITKGTGKEYPGVTGTITNTEWTKFEGTIVISTTGTLTGLEIYAEGPAANVEYWVDDVEVVQDDIFV